MSQEFSRNPTEINMPTLFVPDKCLENCRFLRKLAKDAVYLAATKTDATHAVVCDRPRSLLKPCTGELVEPEHKVCFGDGYAVNIVKHSTALGPSYTVSELIEAAREAGAQEHSLDEL